MKEDLRKALENHVKTSQDSDPFHSHALKYIEELENFITELEPSPRVSSHLEDLSRFVVRGSNSHKLWQKLRLARYPGDF